MTALSRPALRARFGACLLSCGLLVAPAAASEADPRGPQPQAGAPDLLQASAPSAPAVRLPLPSGLDPEWQPLPGAPGVLPPETGADELRLHPSAPGLPPVGADAPAEDRSDLWQRVRGGVGIPDLEGDLVRRWEQWYASRPDYVERMTQRGARYLFHIVEEVHKRGLPAELALLPFIESAFNPQALSVARASGIWQFMPATGRDFDLRQNLFRDDRRDVMASTRAALDYLESLHRMFGDWHLALAAYNWGQGNVQRALQRARRTGQPDSYVNLRMPDETRNYVPKLQAVENIVLNPQRFGLQLPPLENHPYFVAVEIDSDIDVALVTRLSGLSEEDFHALNPQLNKPVILAAGTPQLLLPYDNAKAFREGLAGHTGPSATWTAWVAPRTLGMAEAAKLTGMSEQQLRTVNRIPAGMKLRAGSTLLIHRSQGAQANVSERVADEASIALVPERQAQRRRTIQASSRGEPLARLAQRHGVSAAQLARWNGLSASAQLKPRQQLVVLAPAASSRPAGEKRAAPRSTRQQAAPRVRVAQSQASPRR
jgi:membrane-bound lytic murein transglycosylase D